jgi:hypothetical protein
LSSSGLTWRTNNFGSGPWTTGKDLVIRGERPRRRVHLRQIDRLVGPLFSTIQDIRLSSYFAGQANIVASAL